jgi:hypothetical protein
LRRGSSCWFLKSFIEIPELSILLPFLEIVKIIAKSSVRTIFLLVIFICS